MRPGYKLEDYDVRTKLLLRRGTIVLYTLCLAVFVVSIAIFNPDNISGFQYLTPQVIKIESDSSTSDSSVLKCEALQPFLIRNRPTSPVLKFDLNKTEPLSIVVTFFVTQNLVLKDREACKSFVNDVTEAFFDCDLCNETSVDINKVNVSIEVEIDPGLRSSFNTNKNNSKLLIISSASQELCGETFDGSVAPFSCTTLRYRSWPEVLSLSSGLAGFTFSIAVSLFPFIYSCYERRFECMGAAEENLDIEQPKT